MFCMKVQKLRKIFYCHKLSVAPHRIRRSKHEASLWASLIEMFLRPPPVRDALRKLHVNIKYVYVTGESEYAGESDSPGKF